MDKSAKENESGRRFWNMPQGGLRGERAAIALLAGVIGFLFSGLHVAFGARPAAIAFVAFLSSDVYFALLGAVFGAFYSGGGFIAPISLMITLFVRVIIGTAEKGSEPFSEPLLLRMSAALLGGFVQAVYEWLIAGVSVASSLFGASMILMPPVAVFLLSGLYGHNAKDALLGRAPLPSVSSGGFSERASGVFFFVSALLFVHMICRSLVGFPIFGIDPAFVLAAAVTLISAMRYGAPVAGLVGFVSSIGISGVQTVSFALLGLVSGLVFPLGSAYALASGGLAFALWSGYSGGMSGVLSTVPELVIAVFATLPFLKREVGARRSDTEQLRSVNTLSAVGTMALSYRGKYSDNTERFIASIEAVSRLSGSVGERIQPEKEDFLVAVVASAIDFCSECEHGERCLDLGVCPAVKNAPSLAERLMGGERITPSDVNTEGEFCERRTELAKRINERVSSMEYNRARQVRSSRLSDELSLISKMMSEARERDREDVRLNSEASERCESALGEKGIKNFSVRVFGSRREKIFLAIADKDGKIISSGDVRDALSSALSAELCDIEYYRDGEVAMMECSVREKYAVDFACRIKAAQGEVSGDGALGIKTADGVFYGLLCDGMGRGASAHEASDYLLSLTKNLLSFGVGRETLLKFLSCLMARRGEAHSTLDLFRFDLYTGEGSFIKCGAAPSYVRREGTLYRIGSEGTPIGVGGEAQGERVRVEVRRGDVVVMSSDGAVDTQSGALKFITKMSEGDCESLSDFAEQLISLEGGGDDRSVMVIRISEGSKRESVT